MPATKVACPQCSGELPVSAVTVGKRLRCPRCSTSFTVTSETGATSRVDSPTTPTQADRPMAPTKPDLGLPRSRSPQPVKPPPMPAPAPDRSEAATAVLPEPAFTQPEAPVATAPRSMNKGQLIAI